jgi:SAM-dependent methyltransferase
MSILLNINRECDFCGGSTKFVYTPIETKRGMQLNICKTCGLLQSFSTKSYLSRPPGSMSADADRSSFRYTKDLVSDRYLKVFNDWVDFKDINTILDVGSNRGVFINWVTDNYGIKSITAIEPHPDIVESYANISDIDLRNCRFEETQLQNEYYDFAHCIHTLEHAKSAREMLKGVRDSLKIGGIFFLTVPNIIFHNDLIEELFIDPHTYHFSYDLLKRFVTSMGFSVEYSGNSTEADIIFLLKKERGSSLNFTDDAVCNYRNFPHQVDNNIKLYQSSIVDNRNNLKNSIYLLNKASKTKKIVIWGGGRIFDAMITFGGLNPKDVYMVIDKYLSLYVQEIRGYSLKNPSILNEEDSINSILVYIASRDYADEIKREAESYGVSNFIDFVTYK